MVSESTQAGSESTDEFSDIPIEVKRILLEQNHSKSIGQSEDEKTYEKILENFYGSNYFDSTYFYDGMIYMDGEESALKLFIEKFVIKKQIKSLLSSMGEKKDFNEDEQKQIEMIFKEVKELFIYTKCTGDDQDNTKTEIDPVNDFKNNGSFYVLDFIKERNKKIFIEFFEILNEETVQDSQTFLNAYRSIFIKNNPAFWSEIEFQYSKYTLFLFLIQKYDTISDRRSEVMKSTFFLCVDFGISKNHRSFLLKKLKTKPRLMCLNFGYLDDSNSMDANDKENKMQFNQKIDLFENTVNNLLLKFVADNIYKLENDLQFYFLSEENLNLERKCPNLDFYCCNFLFILYLDLLYFFVDYNKNPEITVQFNLLNLTAINVIFFQKLFKKYILVLDINRNLSSMLKIANNETQKSIYLQSYLDFMQCTIIDNIFNHALPQKFRDLCLDVSSYSLDYFFVHHIPFKEYLLVSENEKKRKFADLIIDSRNSAKENFENNYNYIVKSLDQTRKSDTNYRFALNSFSIMTIIRSKIQHVLRLNFLSFMEKFPFHIQNLYEKTQINRKENLYYTHNMLCVFLEFYKKFYITYKDGKYNRDLITFIEEAYFLTKKCTIIEQDVQDQLKLITTYFTESETNILFCDFSNAHDILKYRILYGILTEANQRSKSKICNSDPTEITDVQNKSIDHKHGIDESGIQLIYTKLLENTHVVFEVNFLKNIVDQINMEYQNAIKNGVSEMYYKNFSLISIWDLFTNDLKDELKIIKKKKFGFTYVCKIIYSSNLLDFHIILSSDKKDNILHSSNQTESCKVNIIYYYHYLSEMNIIYTLKNSIDTVIYLISKYNYNLNKKNVFFHPENKRLSLKLYIIQKDNVNFYNAIVTELIKPLLEPNAENNTEYKKKKKQRISSHFSWLMRLI